MSNGGLERARRGPDLVKYDRNTTCVLAYCDFYFLQILTMAAFSYTVSKNNKIFFLFYRVNNPSKYNFKKTGEPMY